MLGPYLAFVRASFMKMLAYRLRYTTGICSYLVYVATYYFLWKSVYANQDAGAQIQGFDLASLVTYVAIGWLGRSFYFNSVDQEIAQQVTEGEIALYLARPVSFQGLLLAGAIGESLFRLLFFTGPIGIVLFVMFPIQRPASLGAALWFVLSCSLSLLVFFHINFLVGISAFRLKSIHGVMRAKHYLIELLSGLLLPISFFPDWLRSVTRCLPFQSISYVPSSIYLGRLQDRALLSAIGGQVAWAAVLAFVSAVVWRTAARHVTVQGG